MGTSPREGLPEREPRCRFLKLVAELLDRITSVTTVLCERPVSNHRDSGERGITSLIEPRTALIYPNGDDRFHLPHAERRVLQDVVQTNRIVSWVFSSFSPLFFVVV